MNVQIIRVFVRLRQVLSSHAQLGEKLRELEARMTEQDDKFSAVFDAIRQLREDDQCNRPKPRIGYITEAPASRKRAGGTRA